MITTKLFELIKAKAQAARGAFAAEPFQERPAWRRALTPVAAVVGSVAVLGVAAISVVLVGGPQSDAAPARAAIADVQVTPALLTSTPPVVAPNAYANFTPFEAEKWNAAIPVDPAPSRPSFPFHLTSVGTALHPVSLNEQLDYSRAVDCLAAAVHYEAATEGPDGMRAVAQVVLNRMRHPAFPHTVCGVVFQGSELPTGCQFTFTCDGSLGRAPLPEAWARARQIAMEALAGSVYAPVGMATHYHTRWVVPYWAPNLSKIGSVGAHIFYRWKGEWGQPGAFNVAYPGAELDVVSAHGVGKAPFHDESILVSLLTTQANAANIQPVAEIAAVKHAEPAPVEAVAPVSAAASAVVTASETPKPIEVAVISEPPAPAKPTNPFQREAPRISRLAIPGGRF